MTTLIKFISVHNKRGISFWINYSYQYIKMYFFGKEPDKYKPTELRISRTVVPENYPVDSGCLFSYLESEYQGRIMVRYKERIF